jgi:hypothetical protein
MVPRPAPIRYFSETRRYDLGWPRVFAATLARCRWHSRFFLLRLSSASFLSASRLSIK